MKYHSRPEPVTIKGESVVTKKKKRKRKGWDEHREESAARRCWRGM